MVRLRNIRDVIASSGPADETEARRLALKASSRISNPAVAAALHEQFVQALSLIGLGDAMGGDEGELRRENAMQLLAEIEKASASN